MIPLAQVDCHGCGACCLHVGYPPLVALPGDEDWDRLPEALKIGIDFAMQDGRSENGLPCIWLDLDTRRCLHYDLRPSVCRKFPRGGLSCLTFRAERGIDAG